LNFIGPCRKRKALTAAAAAAAAAAAIQQENSTRFAREDIRVLSEEFNAARTAQLLNVPIEMVEAERAKIGEYNQIRRKFLASGDLDLTTTCWCSYGVHDIPEIIHLCLNQRNESKRTRQASICPLLVTLSDNSLKMDIGVY
jgi:hypothetical protein